jgi:hypothetical protein
MQTVERTRYRPRKAGGNATCAEVLTGIGSLPPGPVEWKDRMRLDVAAGASGDEFALTGADSFERKDISAILRTAVADRGEFSTFLKNLMAGDGQPFQPLGLQQTPLGKLLVYGFTVPAARSHFLYGAASPGAPHAGYNGYLYATPDSNDLKRLTLEAEDAGDACRVQYSIDYKDTRVGERTPVLPQTSVMDVVYRDGKELHSETYYSSCHRPVAPAAQEKAADAPKPLPPNVRLEVRFQVPIDGETAAAGDPVVGVIRTTVKDKQSGMIVHAGDRLHGRIAALEEYLLPERRWNFAVVFQSIERGVGEHGIDQGVAQPVTLVPLDDGDRAPHDDTLSPAELLRLRPPGGAWFVFHDANLKIDQKFETQWETR